MCQNGCFGGYSWYARLCSPYNCLQIKTKKGKPRDPAKVQDCRAKPDGWFEYTKVVLRVLRVASVSDSAPCHTRVARVARYARPGDVPLVSASGGAAIVLRVLRVLQIQANRLWTWLEGEEEES